MSIQYNAFEIFQIGVEIEKNGKRFYSAEKIIGEELKHITIITRQMNSRKA